MPNAKHESIVVTGFGPFDNHTINASWEAVKLLPDTVDGFTLIKQEIPVEYTHVERNIPKLWEEHNPLLVVHVGVSSEAKKLTIEKCANRDGYNRCDSAGLTHPTGTACLNGKTYISTEIDVNRVCDRLNDSGKIMACLSENAGRYLCEFIYYTSLNIDSSKSLFIHVPPLDQPYSALELSDGILQIIKCVMEQILNNKDEEKCVCAM